MNSPLSCSWRITSGCCLSFAFALLVAFEARAQDVRLPFVSAPPPMKFVPRSERTQLSVVRDAKARTRTTIELAEGRLVRAEQLTTGQQFDAASAELGIYQGLIEEALRYLNEVKTGNNKMRDTYKRLELTLRTHSARLEAIRRTTPTEYKGNINAIADFTCTARTEALNCFFGQVMQETGCERRPAVVKEGSAAEASAETSKPAETSKKEQ
ncbi:MAG TPA: hypothetical protein VF791_18815 [Pyrinomonadaceae bacterium]